MALLPRVTRENTPPKVTVLDTATHTLVLYCPILLVFTVTYATGPSSDPYCSVPQPDICTPGCPQATSQTPEISDTIPYLKMLIAGDAWQLLDLSSL